MIIKNAIVCDKGGERKTDVEIENGVIVKMGTDLLGSETMDREGIYILPGLVDTNVHLLDGTLSAKNIRSVAEEAQKGGVLHVVLQPDLTPSIDNEVVLEYAQNSIKDIEGVEVDVLLNTLLEDMSLSNIAILLKKGAISPFMSTIAKNNIAMKIAQYAQMYDVTLHVKAEDNSLINSGVMLEGDVSSKLGLAGIPQLSEVLHVSRMIEIARHFKIKILFKSLASPRSIELVNKAKEEGVEVSCEVSLHHLLHCDESCEDFNTIAKLNPPLASKEDMHTLQSLLKEGAIDTLTLLHQPNSPVNKEVAFYDAAYGCSAIADALPLYYTKLVKSGMLTMKELVRLCVYNPAASLKKEIAEITEGERNFVIFDTTQRYKVHNSDSLYNGEMLEGAVITKGF